MRLKNFLNEEGMGTATGDGYVENQGGITTKNIEPFYNKLTVTRRRKKKKRLFPSHELTENLIQNIYRMSTFNKMNEAIIPDFIFKNIKKLGDTIGLNVKRSDTLFDYLGRGEKELVELYNLICLYLIAPTPAQRREMESEIGKALKQVNRQRLVAFIMQTDKMSVGLTSIIRHVLMTVFGIEISAYNKWDDNITFVLSHLDKVKRVLLKMNPSKEELEAFDMLYGSIMKTKLDYEQQAK